MGSPEIEMVKGGDGIWRSPEASVLVPDEDFMEKFQEPKKEDVTKPCSIADAEDFDKDLSSPTRGRGLK